LIHLGEEKVMGL